ncbi:GntR family transcriptional regulator [Nocardia sp. NRRL WC-3656]|uniref:GntR family transcriptional regulator n=1 Tax=Nocardia sp. NRRL WC-3656 TaxID=1463824 RepID=UPI001E30053A|nr:GntR family transcriptional regulator [Nocardia sp. NRRL WC-3656]
MPGELKDPDDLRPVYLRIADDLRSRYTPGGQLPSAPKLADEWGVARETARAAIDVLRNEGLVVAWQGRGTFFRVKPDDEEAAGDDDAVLARIDRIMTRLDEFESRLAALEGFRDGQASQ